MCVCVVVVVSLCIFSVWFWSNILILNLIWVNCFMRWMPVSNHGPRISDTPSATHCCGQRAKNYILSKIRWQFRVGDAESSFHFEHELFCRSTTMDTPSVQRTHDVIITSLKRQNDVATSFWRWNDVIITSCVRWELNYHRQDIINKDGSEESTHWDSKKNVDNL